MLYLGIDLGTTFTVAAYVNDHGQPTLFPDFHDANEFRTPSVVHLGEEGCLVGTPVEEILEDEPGLPHARFFKLEMEANTPVFTDSDKREWYPQALSALLLKKILKDVDAFAHEDIGGVLIAVPANFNDAQRRATKLAAQMAGISQVKLIEEPVAAATFYGVHQVGGEQTLFVYDLGGGTFDATVLQSSEDGLYALATEGSNRLGGKHIDERIVRFIVEEFERQHGFKPDDPASQQSLRRFANEAKHTLAKPGKGRVNKTLVIGGRTLEFILTKDRFNQLIDDFVDDTLAVCERALQASGMDWSFIDTVLLTGGSSLLPLVLDKVARASGKARDQLVCKQPHQAVAYGAAILAQQAFGQSGGKALQSICSYDLGIRTLGRDGQPTVKALIDQNSAVPASASTTFYTTRDDQTRMIIEAVQKRGEGDGGEEKSLGYFAFGPIERPRRKYPVEIKMHYDLEGIVTITARDPETGREIRQVMDEETEALDRALFEQQGWLQKMDVNT
ncbi:Hsp70 family protein [Microbulbifer aggregans]|uniref:Hsp70 family protein n=1 Tax=Microbulbifer aggregans TaxID=1769779 RepID=UPI001CFC9949|nr:Hsp70 family protein [Microbulbifer aggregans]